MFEWIIVKGSDILKVILKAIRYIFIAKDAHQLIVRNKVERIV